jgi:hypothetical protein
MMRSVRVLFTLIVCLLSLVVLAQPRVRKHTCDLTDDEWKALNYAFQKLEQLPESVPDNYVNWARIHGFGSPISTGPCKHISEQLWPWHRAYLIYFENALRASDLPVTANVTLPYWDWTQPPTGVRYPKEFETLPGLLPVGSDCPTVSACRDTTPHPTSPFDPATIASIQAIADWTSYGGKASAPGMLEVQPHNTIHGSYIGGLNAGTEDAARDPLFWAHHANLDRLWAEFQAAARSSVPPREPGPVNKNFKINFRRGMEHELSGDYVDISAPWLNYVYQPQQNQCRGGGRLLGAAPEAATAKRALLKIAIPKAEKVVEVPFNVAAPAGGERILLRFSDLTQPDDASYVVRVYLRPSGSDPAKRTEQEQLTFFTLWRSTHEHDHGEDEEQTLDVTLDVTERLRELTAGAAGAKRVLQIDIQRIDERKNFKGVVIGPDFTWRNLSVEKVTPLPQTIR